MRKITVFMVMVLLSGSSLMAQVAVNTDGSQPDPSAILDVKSTTKGALLPRLTQTQITFIVNPANGLMVFCTTDNKFYAYIASASAWKEILYGDGALSHFSCGSTFTISHVAGDVAPVPKTVTYGTVTNIPGEPSKCWITRNLGADQQASSVDDATEASAGWYWQFNRKQGFKHDGTARTPNTTWLSNISEVSDWTPDNDPCTIELGSSWRIPALFEWDNVYNSGGWTNWNGPWNSGLRLHAAGYLYWENGVVSNRGVYGSNWSSTGSNATFGYNYNFRADYSGTNANLKSYGCSVRCLRDGSTALIQPTITTSPMTNVAQTIATGGGNITSDGGGAVTARGVCWSTSPGPAISGSHTTDGSGTGMFVSSLTGLIPNTLYHIRAYATNCAGTSYGNELNFTTLSFCGSSITINHVAGVVAPVSKTVTYGTVSNIPGEPSKCWITSNLGADHLATSVDDATEASAGWYWQFNRKQGYKNDGSTVTPSWTVSGINESSDWSTANDPCAIELGNGWRIPTFTEWNNVDSIGGWINYDNVWNSGLKLHAAGFLHPSDGSLNLRGVFGYYSSSTQFDATSNWFVFLSAGASIVASYPKSLGFSIRCLKETNPLPASCGSSFTKNHIAGNTAPVTKSVTYGTTTNIPGEPSKCWITSNLGADHQATAVDDATESSAGWYWQFNRKQGYKNDGFTRTPSITWIYPISENSGWVTVNDPCNIELGTSWRIPTYTEWYNVGTTGSWTTWTGPWGSGLKLHAAGYLGSSDGSLIFRGSNGIYWSSTQNNVTNGWYLYFDSGGRNMYNDSKAFGFPTRCVRDF